MKVRLLFFAVLRDIAGRNDSELSLPEGACPGDVWQSLRKEYVQLSSYALPPMIAINEQYASADALLRDGDELAFIPPVAGG